MQREMDRLSLAILANGFSGIDTTTLGGRNCGQGGVYGSSGGGHNDLDLLERRLDNRQKRRINQQLRRARDQARRQTEIEYKDDVIKYTRAAAGWIRFCAQVASYRLLLETVADRTNNVAILNQVREFLRQLFGQSLIPDDDVFKAREIAAKYAERKALPKSSFKIDNLHDDLRKISYKLAEYRRRNGDGI